MADVNAIMMLAPDPDQDRALVEFARSYAAAGNWLAAEIRTTGVTDQVRLNRLFYGPLRQRFGLPAQSAVLCLKHVARLSHGGSVPAVLGPDGPVPYDRHLYSMRAIDQVSLATLEGRVIVACALERYEDARKGVKNAELRRREGRWMFTIRTRLAGTETDRNTREREKAMNSNLFGRISRLVSGLTHNAIEQAEQAAAVPIMEQALRDIDEAVREVKAEIGKQEALKHNVGRRQEGLQTESGNLDDKIALALTEGEDKLAEAGASRQLDIDTQLAVLDRSLTEADEEIARLSESLSALHASRREAKARLKELKAAEAASAAPGSPTTATGGAATMADKAMADAERYGEKFTGVPAEEAPGASKELEELAELHRRHAIEERLAAHKAKLKGGG